MMLQSVIGLYFSGLLASSPLGTSAMKVALREGKI